MKRAKRWLSMILCLCLIGSVLPMAVGAAEESPIKLEAEANDVYGGHRVGEGVGGQFEVRASGADFSGGFVFVNVLGNTNGGVPDVTLTFTLTVPAAGTYTLSLTDKDNADRGIYEVAFNGEAVKTVDFYSASAGIKTHEVGTVTFTSTTATLTLTCAGANAASTGKHGLALDYFTLVAGETTDPDPNPDPDPEPDPEAIHTMDDMYKCTYTDTTIQPGALSYRLYLPADYDKTKTYPLLVYLNGAGSRGTDNEKQLANLAPLINPLIDNPDYPCIVAVPQLPGDQQWVNANWTLGSYSLDNVPESNAMKMLMGMIDDLENTYSIDGDRLYLMGQSFGGFGTWDAITRYPDRFAAAIPMCGAGDPTKAAIIKDIPVMVLHGTGDGSVPVSGSQEMVAALKEVGSKVTYLEYRGTDHYIQRRIFEQPDIWMPWLFAQAKGESEVAPDHSNIYKVTPDGLYMFNNAADLSDWTFTGTANVSGSQLEVKAASGGNTLGIVNDVSMTDGMVSAFITIGSGFTGGGGLVFRYQDANNYGHVRFSNGGLELLEMIDGKADVKLTSDYKWTVGRIADLKAELMGNRVVVSVDNDVVFDTTLKNETLWNGGAVGLRYYSGSMKVDDFVYAKPSGGRITPIDFADRQIVQRDPDTKNQTITFTGSVQAEGMDKLELAVVSFADGTPVVDWTKAAVENDSYTATLTVPQGGWYRTLLRATDKEGNLLVTYTGESRWGVGINILCIGQSNMVGQGQTKPYVVADDLVSNFKNEAWTHLEDPYAADDHSIAGGTCGGSMIPTIGNILVENYGVPVGFIPAAQNGASLLSEHDGWLKRTESNPTDRSNLYGNSLYRAKAAGGIEFIIMNQGENNVSRSTDAATYQAALPKLLENYKKDLGYDVPLIYCQLGPAMANSWDDSRDPYMTGIRAAQAAADNGVTLIMGGSEMDLTRNADNLHYTTASQIVIGQRMANAIRYSLGDVDYYKGPEITGAAFVDADQTTIDVSIRHFGGTDITPTGNITGFEVFVDGEEVAVLSATRKDAETITLTLSNKADGNVTLRYLYGCLPDVSGLVKDNSPLALPLCPTGEALAVEGYAGGPVVTGLKGDVNLNGEITAEDALMALQAATGKITLTEDEATAADVDAAVGVQANDALMILQYATKKIAGF